MNEWHSKRERRLIVFVTLEKAPAVRQTAGAKSFGDHRSPARLGAGLFGDAGRNTLYGRDLFLFDTTTLLPLMSLDVIGFNPGSQMF